MDSQLLSRLEQRLGAVHARQRLGMEDEVSQQVFGRGLNFFHPENWYSTHGLMRLALKAGGLYWRGRANTTRHRIVHNDIVLPGLPAAFDGYTVLHLSDLHVDMYGPALTALVEKLHPLEYDLCALTGDYRAWTFGPIDRAMAGMRSLLTVLRQPVYGVLGNHDSIRMVPDLEDMGVRMLLNEMVPLERGGERVYLAGIDDAHYHRVDNLEKSAVDIPADALSLLLSHTPEVYRMAAHTGYDLMLAGHTHGGQICLPGGIPITLDADLPRSMGSGPWRYQEMVGYTSVGAGTSIVEVRLNCRPEITLHHLRCG